MGRNPKRTLSICVFFLTLIASRVPAATWPDFAGLHQDYIAKYASSIQDETLCRNATSFGGCYYYTSYYLQGMASAVEASGNEAELRKLIGYVDNMINYAVTNPQGHKVWAPYDSNTGWPITQLGQWKACEALARVAAVIMQNPTFRSKYFADAARIVDFIQDTVMQLWYINVYNKAVPQIPTDLGGGGVSVPQWATNTGLLGSIAAHLYQATRNSPTQWTPMYLDIARKVGTAFKRKLQVNDTGWIWDYGVLTEQNDPGNTAGAPDTAHATDMVRLVVTLHEAGIQSMDTSGLAFTLADVQRLAATVSDKIWNGSTTAPAFTNYINGANSTYCNGTCLPFENGIMFPGWALLVKYSPKVQTAMSYLLKAMIEGNTSPSLRFNATSHGFVALTGHLMRTGAFPPPQQEKPSAPINLVVVPAQ